eukprot:scaffold160356_cov12-Tisochrysis_lutea.AAC.1
MFPVIYAIWGQNFGVCLDFQPHFDLAPVTSAKTGSSANDRHFPTHRFHLGTSDRRKDKEVFKPAHVTWDPVGLTHP